MDFSCLSSSLPYFSLMKHKQHVTADQNFHSSCYASSGNAAKIDSQIDNLKQCISAYLDSIQMVCQAGSWLAETFSFLLAESSTGNVANEMKVTFSKMLQLSVSITHKAKHDLAVILLELTMPITQHVQAIKECQTHNARVLEKCIHRLSDTHNAIFRIQLNIDVGKRQNEYVVSTDQNFADSDLLKEKERERHIAEQNQKNRNSNCSAEWYKMGETERNVESWLALKERSSQLLRKYKGLMETEIHNLVNHETVSELYLHKLNQRIDIALRNYEVGLRNLPADSTTVVGGFHSSSDGAKRALTGCCSMMEMEQGCQRLPVGQFLHCELPLMMLTIEGKEYFANTLDSSANVILKKNAIRQVLQSSYQKLSISQTDDLSSEILGDVCPARWRTHVKACLQLIFGNPGLVIMDTMSTEANKKQNAVISRKENFITVSVTSIWCLKEDPGTMSLLQRNLDPEKTLATINVRYVSIFNVRAPRLIFQKRLVFHNRTFQTCELFSRTQPGVFVETFVQTGSQNRRRALHSLRASDNLYGAPLASMSAYWLTNRPIQHPSPVSQHRLTLDTVSSATVNCVPQIPSRPALVKSSAGERKKTKKLVVEVKGDSSSEEDKSSDNDDSVKGVIKLLSGCSSASAREKSTSSSENGTKVCSNRRCETMEALEKDVGPTETVSEKIPLHQTFKSQSLPGSFGSNSTYLQECHSISTLTLPHQYLRCTAREKEAIPHARHHIGRRRNAMESGVCSSKLERRAQNFELVAGKSLNAGIIDNERSNAPPIRIRQNDCVLGSPESLCYLPPHNTNTGELCSSARDALMATSNRNAINRSNSSANEVGNTLIRQHQFSPVTESLHQHGKHQQPESAKVIVNSQNLNNNNTFPMSLEVRKSVPVSPASRSYVSGMLHENPAKLALISDKAELSQTLCSDISADQKGESLEMTDDCSHVDGHGLLSYRFKESFGPIGSPIVKRPTQLERCITRLPYGPPSNTWPLNSGLTDQLQGATSGQSEYERYIVEVARNAIMRKQICMTTQCSQSTREAVWNDNRNAWPLPDSTHHRPDTLAAQRKPDPEDSHHESTQRLDVNDCQALKVNPSATRTGTWPPWQLWPSGNSPWD